MGVFDSIRSWFTTARPAPITQPSGTDGIAAPGGYLFRGERNPKLVGHQLWLTISNTLVDSIVVAAAVRYFLNLTSGTEWEVEPNETGGRAAKKGADVVRKGLFDADMEKPWSAIVRKAALYKFYGFSFHEWLARRRSDGLIAFADLQHRPQYTIHWWDKPVEQSPLLGVVQQTRQGHRYYLPRERLFYCVDDTLTDSPDGVGMLRHTIRHTERVKYLEDLEDIAFKTDLRGIPYTRAPLSKLKAYAAANNKGEAWVEQQLAAIQSFGENHDRSDDLSIVLDSTPYFDKEGHPTGPSQWALELLTGNGAPLEQVASAINRINLEIARVIGAEFMLMGGSAGQSGNRSMHEDKTAQFGSLIQSTLGEISGFVRNDLARTLVMLNGLDADTCTPNVLPGSVSTESVQSAAQALLYLAQAGAPLMPGDPAIDQLRARMHVAEQPAITPELGGMIPRTGAAPNGQQTPPGQAPAKPPASANGEDVDVDMTDIEEQNEAAAGGLQP